MKLTWDQVLRWRLHRHHLGATKAKDPVAAARRLSGVHAQVAASAVTATDLRVTAAVTAKKIDKLLYDDRTLVRTWAARGTLHLLPAADLPIWVAAMSTRTRETTASWLRYNGVTAAQMKDILAALPDVLGAEPLTREELADAIIEATGHKGAARAAHPGLRHDTQAGGVPRAALLRPAARPQRHVRRARGVAGEGVLGRRRRRGGRHAGRGLPRRLRPGHPGGVRPLVRPRGRRWRRSRSPASPGRRSRSTASPMTAAGRRDRPRRPGRRRSSALLPAFDPYIVGSTRQLEWIGAAGPQGGRLPPAGLDLPHPRRRRLDPGHLGEPGRRRIVPVVTPFAPLTAEACARSSTRT